MHLDPKCGNRHKCQNVCVSPSCRINNPFACQSCGTHRDEKCQIIPYKKLVKQFHKVQGIYTNQMLKFQQRVQNTFSQLMQGLKKQFIKFRQQFQYINITQKISNIYDCIKKNKENQLHAEKIYHAMNIQNKQKANFKVKDQLQMRLLKQSVIDIYNEVIQRLPPYYSLRHIQKLNQPLQGSNKIGYIQQNYMKKRNITSGILGQHFKYLQQILKKQIYNVHLLYRATTCKFSASQFHKKCNGMSNTVTIAKTQYGNIVIGYCVFPWQSPNNWVYKQDLKQQCFLISPAKQFRGRKFVPNKTKFAIGMHKDYGPAFGDDFVIYDKANNSKNCWSNFPDVYTCKVRPIQHDNFTINKFVGVSDHFQKFNLIQWQVYKISYGEDDQIQDSFIRQYKAIV